MRKLKKKAGVKRVVAAVIAFIIVFVMVVGLLSPFLFGAEQSRAPGSGPPDITITGAVGFDGRYKLMNDTPVSVRLENAGGDFSGKLQLKIDTTEAASPSRYNIYSVPVTLPAGGSRMINMNVPITMLQTYVTVVLLDEKGAEITREPIVCRGANPQSVFAAALTDNEEGLNYIRQLELNIYDYGYNEARDAYLKGDGRAGEEGPSRRLASNLFFLDESTFPDTKKALDNFNIIIINDFDAGRLSLEQKAALLAWLETGGVLVMGAGAGFEKVMRGLSPDFVEAVYEGAVSVDDLTGIHNDAYTLRQPDGEPVDIDVIRVTGGEEYLTKSGESFTTLAYNGTGTVIVHPFDLATEPFTGLTGRDRFLTDCYRHQLDYKQGLKTNYSYMDWSYMTGNLPSLNDSSIYAIFAIVVLYALFVGPVLYLILKKKDAREKGFAVIPITAAAVTLAITVISADTAYKKPILNTVSKIEAQNRSGAARAASATSVFSPAKGDITVSFDKKTDVNFNADNYYYYGGYYQTRQNTGPQDVVELFSGDTPRLTYFNKASWDQNHYVIGSDAVDLSGGLDCDFNLAGETLGGTITNNTGLDFTEILVGIRDSYAKYEDVKAGDTIELDQKVKLDNQYYDLYSAFTAMYGDVYSSDIKLSAEEKRQIYFKQNLFMNMSQNNGYSYSTPVRYGGSAGARSAVSTVAVAVSAPAPSASASSFNVTVIGFNNDKLNDTGVKVNGRTPNEYNTNLLVMNVPLDIEVLSSFDFPYGLIQVGGISTDALYDYSDMIYMRESGDVELMFTLLKDARVDEFQIKWELDYGEAEIYNTRAGEWEPLAKEAYVENAGDYISGEDGVAVRLRNADAGSLNIPRIRVKGGKDDA